jgi:hypothetical protein
VRFLAASLLIATVAFLALGGAASADHGDGVARPCADIVDGQGTVERPFTSFPGLLVVDFQIETAAPSCRNVHYLITIRDDPNSAHPISLGIRSGNNTNTVNIKTLAYAPDGDVCITVTSRAGLSVLDRAPDHGCMTVGVLRTDFDGVTLFTPFDCITICDSCADFVGDETVNTPFPPPGPLTFDYSIDLASPSCPDVTYTINVVTGDNTVLETRSVQGNGTTELEFTHLPIPASGGAHVEATSSGGGHTLDAGVSVCEVTISSIICPARSFH